jgi:hypothetical protein
MLAYILSYISGLLTLLILDAVMIWFATKFISVLR